MHTDARKLEDHSLIEADLCIVGAGAAGVALALDWEGRKEKVVLLEGGGFEYEQETQALNDGTLSGQRYYPLMSTRLHYFGGTTGHWSGLCTPLDAIDFKKRDWIPDSGWPIDLEALVPYYPKAESRLGLENVPFDLPSWQKILPNMNALPLNSKVFYHKIWQYSKARYATMYRQAITDSRNLHLYTHANAVELVLNDARNELKEIKAKTLTGKSHRIRAKKFVLACGAIQNSRLLLASNHQLPGGVGNQNDLVGRYFMEHPELAAGELWLYKPFNTDLYVRLSAATRASAEIAFTESAQREYHLVNGTFSLFPLAMGQEQTPRIDLWQNKDPRKSKEITSSDWGVARRKSKDKEGAILNSYKLNVRLEQSPNRNSRVTLGGEKDALGVPKAHLHWELQAVEKHSLRTMCQLLGQSVGAAGLGRVRLNSFLVEENDDSFPDFTNGGWHHMGTTRMHENPKKGVVDARCRVHGVNNLFVAGSSCFTTGGAANPTLTLTALTLRLSEHLKTSP